MKPFGHLICPSCKAPVPKRRIEACPKCLGARHLESGSRQVPMKRRAVALLLSYAILLAYCGAPHNPLSPTSGETASVAFVDRSLSDGKSSSGVPWGCMTATNNSFPPSGCGQAIATFQPLTATAEDVNAPTGLTYYFSGGQLTLTWNAPLIGDRPTSYVIEAGSASGLSDLAIYDTRTSFTTLTIVGVQPNTYYVRVRSKNNSGVSAPSNQVVITISENPSCIAAPDPPVGLAGAVLVSTITLTWNRAPSGCAPTSYFIEVGSSPGASNLANFSTGNPATTFVATGVRGGTYYVRIRASNASGKSGPSNEVTLTVGTPTSRITVSPSRFTGPLIRICQGGSFNLNINITAPSDVRWTFRAAGFGLDPEEGSVTFSRNTGTGTGTVGVTIVQRPSTYPFYTCVDLPGQLGSKSTGVIVDFFDSSGREIRDYDNAVTDITWPQGDFEFRRL
jgi:hypothetical protein